MTARADDLEFRTQVDASLAAFVDRKAADLRTLGSGIDHMVAVSGEFIAGGKRLRPQFSYAGWLVAGGAPGDPGMVAAAAALEWLQASALVHDDLMDGSDTRPRTPQHPPGLRDDPPQPAAPRAIRRRSGCRPQS
ncbi:polyprenyl synthetase family protein [Aeromicrobium sp. UC242_57]|uniref:polyprenyl synthetase family protein n=1 Tax=Aeromicrobium sp. UC242_57 TaxID=3374624 RepID=UPI0037886BC4